MAALSSFGVFGPEELRTELRKYLASGEWWCILGVTPAGQVTARIVEEAFYDGDANADFCMILGGFPGVIVGAIFFAKKTRMSADGLCGLYEKSGVHLSAGDILGRDVIIPSDLDLSSEFARWFLYDVGKGLGPRF